ncbi:hypothetical protein C8R46DRAFT_236174 [Mycena filopes]|nr:hypothetical protein C8R46DRAFT_236174 [Mycena filopes]
MPQLQGSRCPCAIISPTIVTTVQYRILQDFWSRPTLVGISRFGFSRLRILALDSLSMLRRLRLPISLGRASATRRYAPAKLWLNKIVTNAPRASFSSNNLADESQTTINDLTRGKKKWYPPDKPHEWNCMCRDPNAHLTKDTLLKLFDFTQKLDPSALSYTALDAAITHCLEYLRSVDVPLPHMSCCAHTLGQYHSEMALAGITKIIASGQLELNPHLTARLSDAMPEIRAWWLYTLEQWLFHGCFIGRENKDRVEGFRSLVPFFDAASRDPDLREAMIETEEERDRIHILLSFCWQMESEDWFEEDAAAGHFPFTSASSPLWTLMRSYIKDGKITIENPTPLRLSPFRDPDDDAKAALHRLEDSATTPLPALAGHIGMLSALALEYPNGLVWQHSIGKVTRLLRDITSVPYRAETAMEVEKCIYPCLFYLSLSISHSDGRTLIAEALHLDIIPSLVRASQWITPEHPGFLEALFGIAARILMYTIYPSIFWPFLASVDKLSTDAIWQDMDPVLQSVFTLATYWIEDSLALVSPDANLTWQCENCSQTSITPFTGATCEKCFMISYCSEACQKAHSESHRAFCEQVDKAREEGERLYLLRPQDAHFAVKVGIAYIRSHRAEIAEIWRAEVPDRVPVVSVDYSSHALGIGERDGARRTQRAHFGLHSSAARADDNTDVEMDPHRPRIHRGDGGGEADTDD